jgi:hypothetical protein
LWKDRTLAVAGLKIQANEVPLFLIITAVLVTLSYFLMSGLAESRDVSIELTDWRNYYHSAFYVLNEEIVIGAFLLHMLIRYLRISPLASTLLIALSFAIIHFVFYKWIFLDRGNMQFITLLTLFFVGLLRNNLIIISGHIAYSWALHFSWIAVMFGSHHISILSGDDISELDRFNTYLGSVEMLIISGVLAVVSFFFWKHRKFSNSGIESNFPERSN